MRCIWSDEKDERGYYVCTVLGCDGYARTREALRNCSVPLPEVSFPVCKHRLEATSTIKIKCCPTREHEHQTYKCELHGRCIPTYHPAGRRLKEWNERKPESDIYTLCPRCGDFEQ